MRRQWGPWSLKQTKDPSQREVQLQGSENNAEHVTAEKGQQHPLPWITHPFLVEMVIC